MVKKRDGRTVQYDGNKVLGAMIKAMLDEDHMDDDALTKIESEIKELVTYGDSVGDILTVDQISDQIENKLIENGLADVARAYITWRTRRDFEREFDVEYKLLSSTFLSKYKHATPPMTEIGLLTYYRTYSRYIPEKKRREYWWETVARAVNYNCSLDSRTTVKEAERLYDNIFNLRQFLSGRTFWSGGTDTAYTNPISQYNCSGLVIEELEAYSDICYLLMLGVGVGFSVQKQYVKNLPMVRGDLMVNHLQYNPVDRRQRKEVTEFHLTDSYMEIIVGDSKMGWAKAVEYLLKAFYSVEFKPVKYIGINYNNVRPHGEPLKTFGGTASGHGALMTILEKIVGVMTKDNTGMKKLSTLDAMDIGNIIAEGIVVGGKL